MSDQDKRLGVYFHIPFCASKCAYCDFCSLPGRDKLMPYYQDALLIQLQETMPRMTDYFIDTVYFGGGTPSYYGARRIVEILQELKVTNRLMKQSEITVECNPDSVRRKELRMLRKEGVNRLSIGAQSANDDILRLIGRRHNWRQVEMAVKRARKAGFRNVSLDLIYGLPSQTREDWADTLTKALALKPAHISCYGLRLEEGTPMYDEYEGTDILPSDDDQADMYLYAVDFLSRHGFRQYEISNFAKPGKESRHNLKYWTGGEYVGFGPGAHSYFGGRRYAYPRDLEGYIRAVAAGSVPLEDCQTITATEQAREYLLLQMRTLYGIEEWEYRRLFGLNFDPIARRLEVLESHRWVEQSGHRWHFTPQGFLLSNTLILDLLEAQSATLQVKKDWKAFLGPPDAPQKPTHP